MTDAGWLGSDMPPMPPESRPPAVENPPVKRLKLLGILASVFIVGVVLVGLATVWYLWKCRAVLQAGLTGEVDPAIAYSDYLGLLDLASDLDRAHLILLAVSAVVFITWLWLARRNSELLSDELHARGRGWVIGSWFVPFANLVFPYQVVRDVWGASHPGARATPGELRIPPPARIVGLWWACFVSAWIIARIALARVDNITTFEDWTGLIVLITIAYGLLAAAAVLIVVIIRQVTRWQQPAVDRRRTGLVAGQ